MLGVRLGEERGPLATRRVERRGLELDPFQVRRLGREGARGGHFGELPVAEREDGLRDDGDDLRVGQHRRKGVGLREQVVPDDDRDVVAPGRVHGGDVPPQLRRVDDVVMDERGGVDQLERLREIDHDLSVPRGAESGRQEDERRPKELPGRAEEVLHRGGEGRMPAAPDVKQALLQLLELSLHRGVERPVRGGRLHAFQSRSAIVMAFSASGWAPAEAPGWGSHPDQKTDQDCPTAAACRSGGRGCSHRGPN